MLQSSQQLRSKQRQLFKACRQGNAQGLHEALKDLSDFTGTTICTLLDTTRTTSDETLLHLVATYNATPIPLATLLLDLGHASSARDTHFKTPLHEATRRGDVGMIQLFLDRGAGVDEIRGGDWTSLLIASANGHVDAVRVLLERGANVTQKNGWGESALHLAARQGSLQIVQMLIAKGAQVQAKTKNGSMAVHYAARAGNLDIVKELVERGGAGVGGGGMTALHEAAAGGKVEVVRWLGKEEDVEDVGGLTALHHAVIGGDLQTVRELKDRRNGEGKGMTAVKLAEVRGEVEIANVLRGEDQGGG